MIQSTVQRISLVLSLCLALLSCHEALADDPAYVLKTSTTQIPYTLSIEKDGKNTGVAVDVVLAAMERAGLKVEKPIVDLPWKRAQEEAKAMPNSLLFAYVRTTERESTVKWIAPILDEAAYLYTLKDAPAITSMDDMRKLKSIGVQLGGSQQSRAAEWGISNVIDPVPDQLTNAKKLVSKRLDGWISLGYMARYVIANAGLKDQIKESFKVQDSNMWVATSLSTPDENVEKVRKAIENFKTTPEYKKILAAYN
jgi:polar amino acid transport system substrate-binding protein